MYSVELILTFFNVFTDFMEKTMPAITPSSESDDGIPQWLLYSILDHPCNSVDCHTPGDSDICASYSKLQKTQ